MRRRQFIRTGLAAVGTTAIADSVSARVDEPRPFARHEAGRRATPTSISDLLWYSEWVPAESHVGPDAGVTFTHIDWDAISELEDDSFGFEEPGPALEGDSVFTDVDSLLNTLAFDIEEGTMRTIEARFSGLYPADTVPSETEVRDGIDPTAPHGSNRRRNQVCVCIETVSESYRKAAYV